MQNWQNYFSSNYLFNASPSGEEKMQIGLAVFFLLLIIVGILVFFILGKKYHQFPPFKPPKIHIINCSLFVGITGLLLLFFRWQNIPYLSMRFLLLVLLVAFLIWLVYIIIYIRTKLIYDLKKFQVEQRYQSYIIRKK